MLHSMFIKFWKYVKMSYNIMSTLKNCIARQLMLQKTRVNNKPMFRIAPRARDQKHTDPTLADTRYQTICFPFPVKILRRYDVISALLLWLWKLYGQFFQCWLFENKFGNKLSKMSLQLLLRRWCWRKRFDEQSGSWHFKKKNLLKIQKKRIS